MQRKTFIHKLAVTATVLLTASKDLFSQKELITDKFSAMDFETAIIGGASAGLSAALALGRSNRKTIVIDSGSPRNKPAPHAHNIFTRDGTPPSELLHIAREQLRHYPSVTIRNAYIREVKGNNGAFELTTSEGEKIRAKKLLLATGVTDVLPDITGINSLWGTKVIHCPYCHGWEVKDQPVAILMNGKWAAHLLPMVYNLNKQLYLFTNGKSDLPADLIQWMNKKNIQLDETPVTELEDHQQGVLVKFEDGRQQLVFAVYAKAAELKFQNQLAIQLGCKLSEAGSVEVDELNQSSVPGVYAIGDLSHPGAHQVIFAAASGAKAAMACNNALIQEAYEQEQKN